MNRPPDRRVKFGRPRTASSYSRSTTPSYRTCPGYLEDLGPFVIGDPLYDPGMDWDGDGVSCE